MVGDYYMAACLRRVKKDQVGDNALSVFAQSGMIQDKDLRRWNNKKWLDRDGRLTKRGKSRVVELLK